MNDEFKIDFPIEQIYSISDNPDLKLRLTIGKNGLFFWVEVDLVSHEGHKIIHHFGIKQNIDNFHDAIQSGLHLYESVK